MLRYVSGRFKRASLPSNSNPPLGERNASCGGQSNTSARALRPQGLKTSSDKAWEVSWVSPARRSASGNRQGATLLKRIIAKQAHSYMCHACPQGSETPAWATKMPACTSSSPSCQSFCSYCSWSLDVGSVSKCSPTGRTRCPRRPP